MFNIFTELGINFDWEEYTACIIHYHGVLAHKRDFSHCHIRKFLPRHYKTDPQMLMSTWIGRVGGSYNTFESMSTGASVNTCLSPWNWILLFPDTSLITTRGFYQTYDVAPSNSYSSAFWRNGMCILKEMFILMFGYLKCEEMSILMKYIFIYLKECLFYQDG